MTATFGPGASRSDSTPPQRPPSGGAPAGVSDHVPHCLQWPPAGEGRFSDPPAGAKVDFVSPVGSPTTLRSARPARCFVPKGHFYEAPGGFFVKSSAEWARHGRCFCPTPQKHETFAIGNSKNTINFEVSDQQKRPNLVHSDSKPCFSALGRSPRPPAIDFLGLSGSRAPDPSQTSLQAVFSSNPFKNTRFWPSECIETLQITRFPLPAAHRNASKRWPRLGFSRGLREQRPAPKPT